MIPLLGWRAGGDPDTEGLSGSWVEPPAGVASWPEPLTPVNPFYSGCPRAPSPLIQ